MNKLIRRIFSIAVLLILNCCEETMFKNAGETGSIAPSSEAVVKFKVDSSSNLGKIWFAATQSAMEEIESTRVRVELKVSSKDANLEIKNLEPFQEKVRVTTEETSLGIAELSEIMGYPGARAVVITNVNTAGVLQITIRNLSMTETIPSFKVRIIKNVDPL